MSKDAGANVISIFKNVHREAHDRGKDVQHGGIQQPLGKPADHRGHTGGKNAFEDAKTDRIMKNWQRNTSIAEAYETTEELRARIERIKDSINRINALMAELKGERK